MSDQTNYDKAQQALKCSSGTAMYETMTNRAQAFATLALVDELRNIKGVLMSINNALPYPEDPEVRHRREGMNSEGFGGPG